MCIVVNKQHYNVFINEVIQQRIENNVRVGLNYFTCKGMLYRYNEIKNKTFKTFTHDLYIWLINVLQHSFANTYLGSYDQPSKVTTLTY